MKLYYYWHDQLPQSPVNEANKNTFFESLLHTSDRFSYLHDPDEVKDEYSSFAYYGFEYSFITIPQLPGQLIGVVTLVVPGSSGYRAGLQRGDFFSAVNGQAINATTSQNISGVLKRGNGVRLERVKLDDSRFTHLDDLDIPTAHFTENPVYLTKVFASRNKKVGYMFYNYFDGSFDRQLLDSLGKLKSAGISELILDMRYNPGGDVSSAAKIVAALTPVTAEQLFVIYKANRFGGNTNSSFQKTMNENQFLPNDFETVKSYRLSLDRVIVLTTTATASAAELVINCLKPYINVVQIGQTTLGKDMGSFLIDDLRNPKQIKFVIHPLVFKLYNSKSEGDYNNGIKPDYIVDEFASLPLSPIGDSLDPLIQKAMALTGVTPENRIQQSFQPLADIRNSYNSSAERSKIAKPVGIKFLSFKK